MVTGRRWWISVVLYKLRSVFASEENDRTETRFLRLPEREMVHLCIQGELQKRSPQGTCFDGVTSSATTSRTTLSDYCFASPPPQLSPPPPPPPKLPPQRPRFSDPAAALPIISRGNLLSPLSASQFWL